MFSFWPVVPWKQTKMKVKMVLNKSIKPKPIGAEMSKLVPNIYQADKTSTPN